MRPPQSHELTQREKRGSQSFRTNTCPRSGCELWNRVLRSACSFKFIVTEPVVGRFLVLSLGSGHSVLYVGHVFAHASPRATCVESSGSPRWMSAATRFSFHASSSHAAKLPRQDPVQSRVSLQMKGGRTGPGRFCAELRGTVAWPAAARSPGPSNTKVSPVDTGLASVFWSSTSPWSLAFDPPCAGS